MKTIYRKRALALVASLSTLAMTTTVQAQERYGADTGTVREVRQFTTVLPRATKATPITAEVVDGMVIYEGDIVLGPLASFENQTPRAGLNPDAGSQAVVRDGAGFRWPNSSIPFVIAAGHPKKAQIEAAIKMVNDTTNICVIPRDGHADFVQFVDGSGCSSAVGKQGGGQNITIGACSTGSIAHEILHAAGLWHEQSREDRDSFITVNLANVEAGKEHNFNRHVADGIDIGSYDYGSIMHYGATAFSKNGLNTIDIKMPPGTANTVIGQRSALSTRDVAAINSLYGRGPCKEDCIAFNPVNVLVKLIGVNWTVADGSLLLYSSTVKAEADRIAVILKNYAVNRSCFVGRPGPSFEYLLRGTASPLGAFSGEDCLPFTPASLSLIKEGTSYLMTDGSSRMFVFPNKVEADLALAVINKYGFNRTCYVGRPGPSLQYLRR
jgi:hypothetical protein